MSLLPEPALAEMADGLVSTEAEEQSTPVGGTSQDGVQTVDTTQSDATEGGVGESASATAVEEAETKAITEAEPVDEAEGVALTTMADEGDLGTLADGDAVAKIGDALYATLKEALEAASAGDTITLLVNLDLTDDGNYTSKRMPVGKSVTIDGGDHTVKVAQRGFGVGVGASGNIDVTFKNMAIVNTDSAARCIDTRGNIGSLTLENVTLDVSGATGNTQALTIGGSQSSAATVSITGSTFKGNGSSYSIMTYNPVTMTIDKSTISGWSALYMKGKDSSAGSAGSTVEITDSSLTSTSLAGNSNAFALVVIEDNDVNVGITGSTVVVDGANNSQAVALADSTSGSLVTLGEGNKVTLAGDGAAFALSGHSVATEVTAGLFNVAVPLEVCAEGLSSVANTDPETKDAYPYTVGEAVATVTDAEGKVTNYASLPDAVAAAKTGETIKLLKDASGAGIFLSKADKKSITIDLDKHTYTVTAAVGSTGTKNQGLHAEKGNAVTLKNGTFTSSADSGVRMLVQNYCDLTLEDVTLDGTKLPDSKPYTLSNNCGKVTIGNGTTIIAKDDGYAFDVCSTKHYPDGAQVTVAEGATINGNIELGVWNPAPTTNKATLTVNGGAINGEIVNNSNGAITKADVVLNAGVYTVDPSTTVKATYPLACYPVKNADGKFEIQPSLESADIEVLFKSATPERTYVYSGSAIEPVTGVQVIKDISQVKSLVAFIKAPVTDKVKLDADDYTVSYKNNVNTGTATATITATDGSLFKGTSTTRDFKITKASATITANDLSKVLGKNDPKLTVTVEGLCGKDKFAEGTDYTIARAKGESVGNYDITVTLVAENQNYDIACKGGTFTITSPKPVDLSKATIGKIADKVYTGKAIKPAPKVTLNGKTLKEGTDYTLVYKNNVNAGTATVTVEGKGAYTGKASATFTIKKAASTIKLADQTKAFNGKAQAYSGEVTKTGSAGKVTYKYYSDSTCKKEVKAANVRKAGTYYVKGTVAADANHAAATSNAAKLTITPGTWQRYGGATALDTGRLVVEADGAFAKGRGGTVIVATSGGYWDALAAAGLAGTLDAPVLITPKDSLASQTAAEIKRLAPSRVLVMGGPAAVSDSTVKAIKALVPSTSRVYGATAPDTAVSIYKKGSGWGKTAIVATSKGYWDALSIAPYAWAAKAPIFLTKGTDDIPASALSALKGGGFTRVVIVGGTAAVSAGVASKVKSATGVTPTRLAGPNALGTSAAIAKWELKQGMGLSHMAVATSNGYWDALTAAAVCGKQNSVLVLVNPGGVYDAFDAVYDRTQLVHGHVLGGEAALPKDVWTYVNKA